MVIHQQMNSGPRIIRRPDIQTSKKFCIEFQEQALRETVAAWDDEELFWAIDELKKRGRIE